MDPIEMYKAGDFNNANSQEGPEGESIITLARHGDPLVYRFAVRDLYGPDEEVLWQEGVPSKSGGEQ